MRKLAFAFAILVISAIVFSVSVVFLAKQLLGTPS